MLEVFYRLEAIKRIQRNVRGWQRRKHAQANVLAPKAVHDSIFEQQSISIEDISPEPTVDVPSPREEAEEEEMEEDEETTDAVAPAEVDMPKAVPIDWSCSDLTLDFEMPKGHGIILRRQSLLPGAWALARGSRRAFQGRQVWHVKILRLPKGSSSPTLLFGVLVQWPGCQPMPHPGSDVLVQPVLVLLADTGEQVFSSNLSPKLLRAPLFPTPLREGETVEIIADLGRRRLLFRRGGETLEAKPLPVRRDTAGRGSRVSNRLRETAYHPFLALQAGVEVELLDTSPWLPQPVPPAEAIILAGPPGAGKSTWAAEYAKVKEGHIHLLGAEWLHHRHHFLQEEQPEQRGEEDNELGDAGRQALAQRILEAFAAFYDDADELQDSVSGSGETCPTETQNQGLPHLEAHEVSPEPNHLQRLVAGVLPELLQRAAARCVSVIADGCHLQASVRAELRAALLHFPGRVRWVVVIPNTLQELLERQGKTQPEVEEWSGSTLPGAEGDCNFAIHEVEFGEGRDHKVFQDWLAQVPRPVRSVPSPWQDQSLQIKNCLDFGSIEMRAILALLCIVQIVALEYTPEALEDEIHDLPGLPADVHFRMFSGYIDLTPLGDRPKSKEIFYWFVEAQKDPDHAPLILWSNGGPGCSGLAGFLTENGPFRVGFDGTNLVHNHYAWNKLANMVFVEQPAGVGFSPAGDNPKYSDENSANDNRHFIMKFYERYPALKAHDFYLSSESYGGHYLPTLGKVLIEKGGVPSFKGMMVGNPLTYMPYRDYGFFGTAWGHQLLPKPLWDSYIKHDCAKLKNPDAQTPMECYSITSTMHQILSGLDPYALDFPTCAGGGAATGQQERLAILRMIARATNSTEVVYQPCSEDLTTHYLNLKEVKEAIHARDFTWQLCSGEVNYRYNPHDTHAPMMPYWKFLIEQASLNLMIFSGDDDSICATLGSQQFVWELGYETTEDKNWAPWKVDDQIAGYHSEFKVPAGGRFAFVTVHGAGHMVPSTQPKRALACLEHFLQKTFLAPKSATVGLCVSTSLRTTSRT
eukprot:s423_g16.t1